jgi:hypothetical protein
VVILTTHQANFVSQFRLKAEISAFLREDFAFFLFFSFSHGYWAWKRFLETMDQKTCCLPRTPSLGMTALAFLAAVILFFSIHFFVSIR